MSEALYNTAILRLASDIPHAGRLEGAAAVAQKVSAICGSRVIASVDLGTDGRVERFAQEVRACALGQASAAILGGGVHGLNADELAGARQALAAYLKGDDGALAALSGRFSEVRLFEPARPYKARHASIMLAFEAAAEAAEQAAAARVAA